MHSPSAQAARRPGGGPRRFPRPVASCTSDAAGAAAVQCRRARGRRWGRACIPRPAPGDRPRALATRAATSRRAAAAARGALGGAPSQCMRPRAAKPVVLPSQGRTLFAGPPQPPRGGRRRFLHVVQVRAGLRTRKSSPAAPSPRQGPGVFSAAAWPRPITKTAITVARMRTRKPTTVTTVNLFPALLP